MRFPWLFSFQPSSGPVGPVTVRKTSALLLEFSWYPYCALSPIQKCSFLGTETTHERHIQSGVLQIPYTDFLDWYTFIIVECLVNNAQNTFRFPSLGTNMLGEG